MKTSAALPILLVCGLLPLVMPAAADEPVKVSLDHFRESAGIRVGHDPAAQSLAVDWPTGPGGDAGHLTFDLRAGRPLISRIELTRGQTPGRVTVARDADPIYRITVGTRENPPDRPPTMSLFNVFFDSPAKRPHETHTAVVKPTTARVVGKNGRVTVAFDGLTAGPFSGELEVTLYSGSGLIHVEAVVQTDRPATAFVYDTGLVTGRENNYWTTFSWVSTEGRTQTERLASPSAGVPLTVKHRAVAADSGAASLACFPPPHQFFYPRDITDNQKTAWFGRMPGASKSDDRVGLGVRQTIEGGGNYVPWFNAPPGTKQRLGVFYLAAGPNAALKDALRFTRGDRYADLPGHVTFTTHWHMATAVAAMKEIEAGKGRSTPDFVKMFKELNVRLVHLAEFHGDGHPGDPGPLRLPEMRAMFDECRRLSDDAITFLPGEEANVHFGVSRPGQNPGHWLYLFPRPVYWTLNRRPGAPFSEEIPPYGKVYHAGSSADVSALLDAERGLAWTAHPRIKASNWAPDAYKNEPYFRSPAWLGAAWKAMPADLSRGKLGERGLDLLDDMANLGARKYLPGEVDVFKVDHTHELFGHMNVNYLRLDHAPRYDEDWSPVLNALRGGAFFVTTGEVLLTRFEVDGRPSGSSLKTSASADGRRDVRFALDWTFPLHHAEIVSGDGSQVYRQVVDLSETPAFGAREWTLRADLKGRTWVRLEAWDVAANGAFSQPLWLDGTE